MTLKMAALAPIPRPRVITAIAANPGDRRACRPARRRSSANRLTWARIQMNPVFGNFCMTRRIWQRLRGGDILAFLPQ